MASHDAVIERFIQRERPLKGAHIFSDDKRIYSYGTHFPMAIAEDDRNLFIVNGDRWGPTTSKHQNHLRSALATSKYERVIVPFSALRAAGVDPTSITVIEQGLEINEAGCNTCNISLSPSGSSGRVYQNEQGEWVNENYTDTYFGHFSEFGAGSPKAIKGNTHACLISEHVKLYGYSQPHWHTNDQYVPNFKPHDVWQRHLLAPSLLTGVRTVSVTVPNGPCDTCGEPKADHDENGMHEGKEYRWRHVYREPSIRVTDTVYLLSGFDETAREWGGGYFLSQLPKKVNTIEEAYTALAPKPVLKAIADGKYVKRQGDIFGIPDEKMTTRRINKIGTRLPKPKMKDILGWQNEVLGQEPVLYNGTIPVYADDQSPRFYLGAYRPRLLNTNHYATEAFEVVRNGVTETWARGMLYHIPGGRPADHKNIKLGKVWHRIYRNTAVGSWSATARSGAGRVD